MLAMKREKRLQIHVAQPVAVRREKPFAHMLCACSNSVRGIRLCSGIQNPDLPFRKPALEIVEQHLFAMTRRQHKAPESLPHINVHQVDKNRSAIHRHHRLRKIFRERVNPRAFPSAQNHYLHLICSRRHLSSDLVTLENDLIPILEAFSLASYWKGKTVFVTGATGLMGSWLVKALLRDGAEIVALVRDQAPRSMLVREGILQKIAVVNGEVESLPTIRRALAEYQPHTVFHLAAQPLVQVAKLDPLGTLRANVMGTSNVLEACRLIGKSNVVVASSDKAYGENEIIPYLETHPLQGRYPYDVSKSCTDLITQMYAATYALKTAIARCGNLFGGGDLNFSRTIPGVIKATLAGARFVIRSDGKFVRDFLYVKDAAESYLTVGDNLAEDPSRSEER